MLPHIVTGDFDATTQGDLRVEQRQAVGTWTLSDPPLPTSIECCLPQEFISSASVAPDAHGGDDGMGDFNTPRLPAGVRPDFSLGSRLPLSRQIPAEEVELVRGEGRFVLDSLTDDQRGGGNVSLSGALNSELPLPFRGNVSNPINFVHFCGKFKLIVNKVFSDQIIRKEQSRSGNNLSNLPTKNCRCRKMDKLLEASADGDAVAADRCFHQIRSDSWRGLLGAAGRSNSPPICSVLAGPGSEATGGRRPLTSRLFLKTGL